MAYTLKGTSPVELSGMPSSVTVTWDSGVINSSNMDALKMLLAIAEVTENVGQGGGPYSSGLDIIADGLAFYYFFWMQYNKVEIVDGEIPTVGDVPDGAVA